MIYLDHGATSPIRRETLEAMWPHLTNSFGNAASHHDLGEMARRGLDEARGGIAHAMGCRSTEVVFTSGGTESNNLAVKGACLASDNTKKRIVTSPLEHEAVSEATGYLCRFHGFGVDIVRVDREGCVDLDHLAALLGNDVALCSIQYANSEIGTVQPVGAIASLCRDASVPFHADAVGAAGWLPLDIDADLVAISGHKFGGPKGTGVLRCRSNLALEPVMHGGGQERGVRSGTSNVAGAVGIAHALTITDEVRREHSGDLSELRDAFIDAVLERCDAHITGARTPRLVNNASFVFPHLSGQAIVAELSTRNIAISSGSACAEDEDEPSGVLRALGIDDDLAMGAVRFTLGYETTRDDLDFVLRALSEIA